MSDAAVFVDYLRARLPLIEGRLAAHMPSPAEKDAPQAADLDRYLYDAFRRFTASGGKRTRPALCLLGAEAVGGSPECALSVACAVEDFQSAALIHDDIADKGELRRGEPCLYLTEGTGVAINVGDLALVTVVDGILRDQALAPELRLRALAEVVGMEQRTLEGQALDLGWVRDGRWDITPDDYLFMATHKTSYYSAAVPLAVGAICAGGAESQVEALRAFGMSAGLAFQLQDDLLNLVGDAEAQGKDFRSDVTEGKRTLAAVWALHHLDPARATELRQILESGTADPARLARAVELMEAAGAIEHVRAEARRLVGEAKAALDGVELAPEARLAVLGMADFFVERLS